jgi:CheY-like chemotaxis protein
VPRILIAEYDREIQSLVARIVRRLGHEPVLYERAVRDSIEPCAVLIVEPAVDAGAEAARWFGSRRPDAPVICISIDPATPCPGGNVLQWLEKPFSLEELEQAISSAVAATA